MPETTTPAAPAVTLVKVPGGRPDMDDPIRQAAAAALAADVPLKLRLPITFASTQANHDRWNGVSWMLFFAPGPETAGRVIAFREALDAFVRGWVRDQADDRKPRRAKS